MAKLQPHDSVVGYMFLPLFAVLSAALWLPGLASWPAAGLLRSVAAVPMVYMVAFGVALTLELSTGVMIWMLAWGPFLAVALITIVVWMVWIRERDVRRGIGLLGGAYAAAVLAAALVPLYWGRPALQAPNPAMLDASQWVRDNTPKDAVVQGDPTVGGLRTWVRRPVYFESGDDHALYLKPTLLPEYLRRARLMGVDLEQKYHGVQWSPAPMELRALGSEQAFDYLLLPGALTFPFEMVYSNGRYSVYRTAPR